MAAGPAALVLGLTVLALGAGLLASNAKALLEDLVRSEVASAVAAAEQRLLLSLATKFDGEVQRGRRLAPVRLQAGVAIRDVEISIPTIPPEAAASRQLIQGEGEGGAQGSLAELTRQEMHSEQEEQEKAQEKAMEQQQEQQQQAMEEQQKRQQQAMMEEQQKKQQEAQQKAMKAQEAAIAAARPTPKPWWSDALLPAGKNTSDGKVGKVHKEAFLKTSSTTPAPTTTARPTTTTMLASTTTRPATTSTTQAAAMPPPPRAGGSGGMPGGDVSTTHSAAGSTVQWAFQTPGRHPNAQEVPTMHRPAHGGKGVVGVVTQTTSTTTPSKLKDPAWFDGRSGGPMWDSMTRGPPPYPDGGKSPSWGYLWWTDSLRACSNDSKDELRLEASFGHSAKVLSVLKTKARLYKLLGSNGSSELTSVALASAALGDVLYVDANSSRVGLPVYDLKYGSRMRERLPQRLELVRSLFSGAKEPLGFATVWFIDYCFAKVAAGALSVQPAMLRLLAWGVLRDALYFPESDVCETMETMGLKGCGRYALRKHVFRYVEGAPEALLERSDEGRTLLMEASERRVPCFNQLLMIYSRNQVPVDSATSGGETAAMLAVLSGNPEWGSLLEEQGRQRELPETLPLFQFRYAGLAVLLLYPLVLVAGLLLVACRPRLVPKSQEGVVVFAGRVAVVVLANFLLKYGAHPLALLQPWALLDVSWSPRLLGNWLLIAPLGLGFLSFLLYDLTQACRPEPGATALPAWRSPARETVTATSMYQDPRVPTAVCLHTFLLSAAVLAFFISKLLEPVQMTLFSKAMWAGALLVQVHSTTKSLWEGQGSCDMLELSRWAVRLEGQENTSLWRALFRQFRFECEGKDNGEEGNGAPRLGQAEVILRFFMCYLSNGLFQMVTVYALPLYMASMPSAGDFVLSAVAIAYMHGLDGLPAPVVFTVEPEEEYSTLLSVKDMRPNF